MPQKATLKRVITLPLLVFYGAGTILGAGIYTLCGKVAGLSGIYAPVSFLLSAVIASFIAFSYAELSSRYPKSAGEAVYVSHAFSSRWLTALTGWGIVATGIVSAGVMARGFYGYLNEFVRLTDNASVLFFVTLISIIAVSGISLSFKFAAIVTVIEVSGILLILYVSRDHLFSITARWREFIPPFSRDIWLNILLGAFLAFYAFIGFEDMVNVAEELIEPEKILPQGIIIVLVFSAVLYVLVSLASVLTIPVETLAVHNAPFALIIQENSDISASVISLISLAAILNGALTQIIMGSRVLYGLSEKGIGPKLFKFIHPTTRTPVAAIGFFSIALLLITLWLPIMSLARLTSLIILSIFALVTLSLCVIKMREIQAPKEVPMRVPFLIPFVGLILCIGFIMVQFQ